MSRTGGVRPLNKAGVHPKVTCGLMGSVYPLNKVRALPGERDLLTNDDLPGTGVTIQ